MADEPIVISSVNKKEHKRRRRELYLALFCFALIGIITFVQLKVLGGNSYLFVILLNLNFILLLVVLFIVTRNAVKLLLERRRRVLGSKMRTRLVLAFVSLSLIPTALMFFVAVNFVQTSVDYWFKVQVEDSMEQALGLSESFYRSSQSRLQKLGGHIMETILDKQYRWGGKGMDKYLQDVFTSHGLALLAVMNTGGTFQNDNMDEAVRRRWVGVADTIAAHAKRTPDELLDIQVPESDLMVVLVPVDEGQTGYLVLADTMGQDVKRKRKQVITGLNEYQKLKNLKSPWKMTLYMTLGVMTSLIVLGAVWFGFRLAKELSAPVQALAQGTERVARGDLSVRLEDSSSDELGFLVQSFNRMTDDLRESRSRLDKYNRQLTQQNVELDHRGRYMEAVLNNITSGVISMDPEGRVGTVNQAAQDMLGLPGPFLVGKKPTALLRGEYAELIRQALLQMRDSPESQWQRQIDLTIAGKACKFLINVVALTAASGESMGTVAVFEDITELEKVQRLAAWREVARRIAHEIKNPLTPIKLSTQRLQRKFGAEVNDKVFHECTELIITQVERLQQMVTQFSAYAKLPEVQPKTDRLQPLLDEVLTMFRNSYRTIVWSLEYDSDIPAFSFDREAIGKVLINLLTNASEVLAGREDGTVDMVAGYDPQRRMVSVAVCDNGPGFPLEETQRMFEPYFSRKKGGTGLGLTIVRSIIDDHHGQIHVMPGADRGTIFVIELPGA